MSRKGAIFYTFLFCFVVTFGVTIMGITDVIKIRDGYLNVLFGSLVIEMVAAVIALFKGTSFFDDEKEVDAPKSGSRLAIHSAIYARGEKQIDVTEAVRARVLGDTLEITSGNHLGGDPYVGAGKVLTIDYSFDGVRRHRVVPEGDVAKLP